MPRSPGYIPGPLVIPQCVEVVLEWVLSNGKKTSNVLHAFNFVPVAINAALADLIFTNILAQPEWTAYAGRLPTTTALQGVKLRDLNVALGPLVESTSAAGPGTGGTDPIPQGSALVVSLKSSTAGRTGRGRVYLSGFDISQLDAQGHAIAGLTADALAFVQMVAAQLLGQSLNLCIANRAHAAYVSPATGLMVPAAAAGTTIVDTVIVEDNVFDSQRRRK